MFCPFIIYKYPLTPMDPRNTASRPVDHCAAQSWTPSVINRRRSLATVLMPHGHVRRRRQVLLITGRRLSLVYIALLDKVRGCAVTKIQSFGQSSRGK